MDHEPSVQGDAEGGRRGRRGPVTASMLAVFVVQGALQFWLYRGQVVEKWMTDEWVTFGIPVGVGLCGFAGTLSWAAAGRGWSAGRRAVYVIGWTVVAMCVSLWGSLLIPFNMYGT